MTLQSQTVRSKVPTKRVPPAKPAVQTVKLSVRLLNSSSVFLLHYTWDVFQLYMLPDLLVQLIGFKTA